MKVAEAKVIQKFLTDEKLYTGKIDGDIGPKTNKAIAQAVEKYKSSFPSTYGSWPEPRLAIGLLQWLCNKRGIDAGVIDGKYGPSTMTAAQQLIVLESTGTLPRSFHDIEPLDTNPHKFPLEKYAALVAYYGEPCQAKLVKVPSPWKLRLDWDLASTVSSITIHEKLADSLTNILERVHAEYGLEGIKKYGLDRFGGSYNCRKKRGSTTAWSTHAWGIAIDWYPSKNTLRSNESNASLAKPELDAWWDIWEKEGWQSLGRKENRDWMHVQAARR